MVPRYRSQCCECKRHQRLGIEGQHRVRSVSFETFTDFAEAMARVLYSVGSNGGVICSPPWLEVPSDLFTETTRLGPSSSPLTLHSTSKEGATTGALIAIRSEMVCSTIQAVPGYHVCTLPFQSLISLEDPTSSRFSPTAEEKVHENFSDDSSISTVSESSVKTVLQNVSCGSC